MTPPGRLSPVRAPPPPGGRDHWLRYSGPGCGWCAVGCGRSPARVGTVYWSAIVRTGFQSGDGCLIASEDGRAI